MKILNDDNAEKAILAGIIKYGNDAYIDVNGIISANSFTHDKNSIIYKCLQKLLENDSAHKIDIPSIYSTAKELGLEYLFKKSEQVTYLNSLLDFPVAKSNLEKFAKKLRKFEVARLYIEQLEEAKNKLYTLSGDETVSQILSIPEDAIFNFQSLLNQNEDGPTLLFENVHSHVDRLAKNPQNQIGLSSGLKYWDAAIGGGLRGGTVNVISARPKQGKSLIAAYICTYIAKSLNVPALYLDTEMQNHDQINRILAGLSNVEIQEIETGKFGKNSFKYNKIKEISQIVESIPFYYKSIAGMAFEDIVALMRRWVIKKVGLNSDGTAKPCVIIYDYLKLMDASGIRADLKEYQMLGFMTTNLHNFSVKYNLPIVAFLQLNRDGIEKEDTSAASLSDRIIWLCSNFSMLKSKTDEEIAELPLGGNKKLLVVIARHGPALQFGEHICLNFEGSKMRLTELGLNTTLRRQMKQSQEPSEEETDDGNVEF